MISQLIGKYTRLIELTIIALMFLLILAVTLQIAGRYIPFIPRFLWTEEISGFSLIWIIFLSSILGIKEKKHFYIDIFPEKINPCFLKLLDFVYYLMLYLMSFVFVIIGWKFFKMGCIQNSNLSGLNLGFVYFSIIFSGISWLLFLTEDLFLKIKGRKAK
jgi:TRAP-type C4-dicarboxylate transport system permease small subunit